LNSIPGVAAKLVDLIDPRCSVKKINLKFLGHQPNRFAIDTPSNLSSIPLVNLFPEGRTGTIRSQQIDLDYSPDRQFVISIGWLSGRAAEVSVKVKDVAATTVSITFDNDGDDLTITSDKLQIANRKSHYSLPSIRVSRQ
jgi:hypothetical protein